MEACHLGQFVLHIRRSGPTASGGTIVKLKRKLTKSEQMARVRRTETAPELALRRALWRRGLRYRLHPALPGTPDLAFMSARVAVFVDGCFWHGCPEHYTAPKANADFWSAKIEANRSRDARVDAQLIELGWRSVRLWEHVVMADVEGAVHLIRQEINGRPPI